MFLGMQDFDFVQI